VDEDHGVSLLNYGHPAPLLVRADGTVEYTEPPTFAPAGAGRTGPGRTEPAHDQHRTPLLLRYRDDHDVVS
jgi:hypothetical protein